MQSDCVEIQHNVYDIFGLPKEVNVACDEFKRRRNREQLRLPFSLQTTPTTRAREIDHRLVSICDVALIRCAVVY